MAWVRRLPPPTDPKKPRLWAATVRLPSGKRVTETDVLKGVVEHWAAELEADMRRGDWVDPRAGKRTVGDCWAEWGEARRLEKASLARDRSHWRCHVEPRWGRMPVGSILTPDVEAWVTAMERSHKDDCSDRKRCPGCAVGAATIEGAVGVLRAVLHQAVRAKLIKFNPVADIKLPKRSAHLDRVLHSSEDELLLAACDRLFPGRVDGRLMCELLLYCGLRWEEAAGLDRDHVDTRRALLSIGPVMERDGTIRPYPKTPAGIRDVAVDRDLWPRLRAHVMSVPPGGLIITGRAGKPLDYSNWYDRVWRVILEGKPAYAGTKGHPAREAIAGADLDDPQPTPHDLRHTCLTRLGEQGVVGHELMAFSGHESLSNVQRYLHAGDGRHDRARDALERARTSRS